MARTRARREAAGLTVIELMIVVGILSTAAALFGLSMTRSRGGAEVDDFANSIRNAMLQGRRRAIATSQTVIVDVRLNSVAWCVQSLPNQSSCPSPVGVEQIRPVLASAGAMARDWARSVDLGGAPAKVALPAVLYFRPDGMGDTDLTTPLPEGFTIYLQGSIDLEVKRKILVYPFSGRPRTIDRW